MKHTAKITIGSLLLAATVGLAQAGEQPPLSDPTFTSDNDRLIAYADHDGAFYPSFVRIRDMSELIATNKALQKKVEQQQDRLEKLERQEETTTMDKQFQELKKSVEEKDRANRESQQTVQSLKDQISDLKKTLDEVKNKIK